MRQDVTAPNEPEEGQAEAEESKTSEAEPEPQPEYDADTQPRPGEIDNRQTECDSAAKAEHSAPTEMERRRKAKSVTQSVPPLSAQPRTDAKSEDVENTADIVQLSAQRRIVYDRLQWKRSRVKKGFLIRRISGYSIAETEYGISYLYVLARKPDRTSADNFLYGAAGYFNWLSLEDTGLLCKEKKHDKQRQHNAA